MTTWTATAERMPDDDQCVLIAMEDGEVWTGFHADDRWFFVSADPVGSPVTHWAEFPEPPNGEVRGASRLAGEASSAEGATSTVERNRPVGGWPPDGPVDGSVRPRFEGNEQ